jgi:hypothetical protein
MKGTRLLELINDVIDLVVEGGIIKHIQKRAFDNKVQSQNLVYLLSLTPTLQSLSGTCARLSISCLLEMCWYLFVL